MAPTKKADTKEPSTPTSFRLSDGAIAALDKGAARFNMNRTQWLEWLAHAAVSDKGASMSTGTHEIEVRSTRQ